MDLIDRNKALAETWKEPSYSDPLNVLTEIRERLKALPTIEQPEIIRCRDCKYGVQDEIGRWYCRGLGCQIGDDDGSGFCSDAERRDE